MVLLPFLKWPGGKRWFVQNHADLLPTRFRRYIEPFLGGGSVFFHLKPVKAVLADANEDLIATYRGIRFQPLRLVRLLREHERQHSGPHYYAVRASTPASLLARAARLIYLNRTSFNGIYRVNQEGTFNVPKGDRTSVVLPTDDFPGIARLLRGSTLTTSDFADTISEARKGDLIFADPPYTVRHDNNGFRKYNEVLFSWDDQVRLALALGRARDRGAIVVATNANHSTVRQLYRELDFRLMSAVFHATVLPLKNIRTPLGNNYDAVRHIVRDSLKIDEGGAFYETLKWLAYQGWRDTQVTSPSFACPHCHSEHPGLPVGADEGRCPTCKKLVFLTDMIGFHLDMDEESAPDSVASAYMLVTEHLMLFTAIRLLWHHSDKQLLSDTLFIKDGPLSLRGQYSKLVPGLRSFLAYGKRNNRPVHVIGQEKTGAFVDHLRSIVRFAPPHDRGEDLAYAVLSHDYVRKEVYRTPDLANPYGMRTNWGEKVLVKLDPGTFMVLNVPPGHYDSAGEAPAESDLIGLPRILATLPSLVSHKFEGALFPIELANGIASMSSYPSSAILRRFMEGS